MSKLYTTVRTDAIKTEHTARGHHWAKVTVRSWDYSFQIQMTEAGLVEIRMGQGSTDECQHLLCTITPEDAKRLRSLEPII